MDFFYISVALLTAGVSLLSGLINIFIGLQKSGDKTDLIFGILSLSVFIFLVLPPVGFVLEDKAPYSDALCIKRVFIWIYYGLLPWFFEYYTRHKQRLITYAIDASLLISYFTMTLTRHDSQKPSWLLLSLLAFGLIFYCGFRAGISLLKTSRQNEGKWLVSAMAIYGFLYLLGLINQLGDNYFGRMMGSNKMFYPFHLNMLAFIIIVAIRLRENTQEKYILEKKLRWQESKWNLMVQNMNLFILELDRKGNILRLNPYAVKELGYKDQSELIGKNWFTTFASKEEIQSLQSIYNDTVKHQKVLNQFTSHVVTKDGNRRMVTWNYIFDFERDESLRGVLSIGIDNTEQVKSFEQIRQLKNELQKENLLLKGEMVNDNEETDIIGQSEVLRTAVQKARLVAATHAGVLLLGETGSGKELFAQLIHRKSYRHEKPFIKVNCAALPSELIESELFGHEKGSFTGAIAARKGKFELADEGTIFLDEIGELPLSLQSKLLRVLQEGEFERIGGQQVHKIDVRIIAATNRNLDLEVREGQFREDLYYRLNVFPITVPALRERKSDVPLLIAHFVKKYAGEHNKLITDVTTADMANLASYDWPGNVRELINLIERSVIVTKGQTLQLDWQTKAVSKASSDENGHNPVLLEDVERAHILKTLQDCKWKINGEDGAAGKLGMHPSTLRSRMKKLKIERSH